SFRRARFRGRLLCVRLLIPHVGLDTGLPPKSCHISTSACRWWSPLVGAFFRWPSNPSKKGAPRMDATEFKPGGELRRSGYDRGTGREDRNTAEDAVCCVWFEKVGNKRVARNETFSPLAL